MCNGNLVNRHRRVMFIVTGHSTTSAISPTASHVYPSALIYSSPWVSRRLYDIF